MLHYESLPALAPDSLILIPSSVACEARWGKVVGCQRNCGPTHRIVQAVGSGEVQDFSEIAQRMTF